MPNFPYFCVTFAVLHIYAIDLSLDSDGDGIPNWRDPNRTCIDPAEIQVTSDLPDEFMPEIWNGSAVWVGDGDIFGTQLQPLQPQPRPPVTGTPPDKAVHWLNQQTVPFVNVEDIPGYNPATGKVKRYKTAEVMAEYEAITGTYVVSFDFCYYGTPDQKQFLGRFGRGFSYDQALALIARTMIMQKTQAEELGRYVSSFENKGQLPTTPLGSFGFSFNGQGYWGEKDNFYDMNYLRTGANAWLGSAYLFYADHNQDEQFMDMVTRLADHLIDDRQIMDPDDPRYGLFTGGYGTWINGNVFTETMITWVSAEHNIDTYFFLRDLGKKTGDDRYSEAAILLKENMPKLWNEEKGRLNQGMSEAGILDETDALDAASWGAIYWTAVGDFDRAKRSLEFADQAYLNTATVSNTLTISPEITISGYRPHNGIVDGFDFDWSTKPFIWSEGSLGVAMAHLKLGHALLNQCDLEGNTYIQNAKDIVAEMEQLQELDPEGGLFYAAYPGQEVPDFARAPSVAGTAWYLMVRQVMTNPIMRDTFWGPDSSTGTAPPQIGDHQVFLPLIMTSPCP